MSASLPDMLSHVEVYWDFPSCCAKTHVVLKYMTLYASYYKKRESIFLASIGSGYPSIFCSKATNIQAGKTTGSGTKPIRYLSRSKKPMPIEGYAGSAAASMAAGAAVYMLKDDLGLGEVAESPAGTVRSLLASTSDEEIRSLGGVGGGGGGLEVALVGAAERALAALRQIPVSPDPLYAGLGIALLAVAATALWMMYQIDHARRVPTDDSDESEEDEGRENEAGARESVGSVQSVLSPKQLFAKTEEDAASAEKEEKHSTSETSDSSTDEGTATQKTGKKKGRMYKIRKKSPTKSPMKSPLRNPIIGDGLKLGFKSTSVSNSSLSSS